MRAGNAARQLLLLPALKNEFLQVVVCKVLKIYT